MDELDWRDLQMAWSVAEHGSLSGAARALGMAPSTLQRRISALEADTGVVFFERLPHGYVTTPAGEYILEALSPAASMMQEVGRRVSNQSQPALSVVTVTAPLLVAQKLCALLPEFIQAHPEIRLVIQQDEQLQGLHPGARADVALRVTRKPDEHLWGQRIGGIDFVIAGKARFASMPAAQRPWVVFEDAHPGTPQQQWERAHVPESQRVLVTSSRQTQVEAVRQGCGVGLVPELILAGEELVLIERPDPPMSLELWVLAHPSCKQNAGVRETMRFLGERARALFRAAQRA